MKRMAKGEWIKFTATGEFRLPKAGEYILLRDGTTMRTPRYPVLDKRTILRRTESRGKP